MNKSIFVVDALPPANRRDIRGLKCKFAECEGGEARLLYKAYSIPPAQLLWTVECAWCGATLGQWREGMEKWERVPQAKQHREWTGTGR